MFKNFQNFLQNVTIIMKIKLKTKILFVIEIAKISFFVEVLICRKIKSNAAVIILIKLAPI